MMQLTSNVIGPIVPASTGDEYPTHYDTYGYGGFRIVNTILERDSIPEPRRCEGMLVKVLENNTTYSLKHTGVTGTIITADWELSSSSDGDAAITFFLDPRLTSEAEPYIAGINGEERIILRYPDDVSQADHVTAFVVLPNQSCIAVWNGITAHEVAMTLHSDSDMYLDTSTNDPHSDEDLQLPSCIILSDRITNMQTHHWYAEGLYPDRPPCCGNGFIIGTRSHIEFEFYRQDDIDSWTVAGGCLEPFLETLDDVDGWGHPAELNDSGALKRYSLNQTQYNKLSDAAAGYVYTTHQQLLSDKMAGRLIVNQKYVIEDFHHKYIQPQTCDLKIAEFEFSDVDFNIPQWVTDVVEPLILTAISTTEFNPECSSLTNPSDVLIYDITDTNSMSTTDLYSVNVSDQDMTGSSYLVGITGGFIIPYVNQGNVYIQAQPYVPLGYRFEPIFSPNGSLNSIFYKLAYTIEDCYRTGKILKRTDKNKNISLYYDWRRTLFARFYPNRDEYHDHVEGVYKPIQTVDGTQEQVRGRVYISGSDFYLCLTTNAVPDTNISNIKTWFTLCSVDNYISNETNIYDTTYLFGDMVSGKLEFKTFDMDLNSENIYVGGRNQVTPAISFLPDIVWKGVINNISITDYMTNSTLSGDFQNINVSSIDKFYSVNDTTNINCNSITNTFGSGEINGLRGTSISNVCYFSMTDCDVDILTDSIIRILQNTILYQGMTAFNITDNITDGIYFSRQLSQTIDANTNITDIGSSNTINGSLSTCLGTDNTSIGDNNLILGKNNIVNGDNQIVIGESNVVSGENDIVLANNILLQGYRNFVVGRSSFNGIERGVVGNVVLGWGANLLVCSPIDNECLSPTYLQFSSKILGPSANQIHFTDVEEGDDFEKYRFSMRVYDYLYLDGDRYQIIDHDGIVYTLDRDINTVIPDVDILDIRTTPTNIAIYSTIEDISTPTSKPVRWLDPVTYKWNDEIITVVSGGTP